MAPFHNLEPEGLDRNCLQEKAFQWAGHDHKTRRRELVRDQQQLLQNNQGTHIHLQCPVRRLRVFGLAHTRNQEQHLSKASIMTARVDTGVSGVWEIDEGEACSSLNNIIWALGRRRFVGLDGS